MTLAGPAIRLAQCAFFIVCILLVAGALDAGAGAPFGLQRGAAPPEVGGFAGWILAKQAKFYRMLSGPIRAAKADGSAAYTLLGISFIYGIFHAAGPGHGKAVISSYLVANDETWRRGVVLSFASAILQALTAIAIVGIAAVLLGATAKAMGDTVRIIEMVSYGLIILIGLRLLWVKGRSFLHLLRPRAEHDHAHHDHAHDHMPRPSPRSSCARARPCHHHDDDEKPRLGPRPCAGAERADRPALAQARACGHRRGRLAALLGRDHRAGVRAGARAVLDRRRLDLRDGARHRHHGRGRRHASRSARAALPGGWPRPSPAPAC